MSNLHLVSPPWNCCEPVEYPELLSEALTSERLAACWQLGIRPGMVVALVDCEENARMVFDAVNIRTSLVAALEAIVEAGWLCTEQPRAVYCAEIAKAALAKLEPCPAGATEDANRDSAAV